jgi:hypothetical protein
VASVGGPEARKAVMLDIPRGDHGPILSPNDPAARLAVPQLELQAG